MIQERSILKVADNSGAKTVRCFRILGGTRRRYARIGDIVVASVQVAEPRKTVKKKDIVKLLDKEVGLAIIKEEENGEGELYIIEA